MNRLRGKMPLFRGSTWRLWRSFIAPFVALRSSSGSFCDGVRLLRRFLKLSPQRDKRKSDRATFESLRFVSNKCRDGSIVPRKSECSCATDRTLTGVRGRFRSRKVRVSKM